MMMAVAVTHGKEHVRHILLHGPGVINHVHRLVDTLALSSKDGLIDAEAAG